MVRSLVTKPKRVVVARAEPGEDILEAIERAAADNGIRTGQFSAIGALAKATLGFFNRETASYQETTIVNDLEIVSCSGSITTFEGSLIVHAHIVVADAHGLCYGGHVRKGCEVSVTLEISIIEMEREIRRKKDKATGLNLMDI